MKLFQKVLLLSIALLMMVGCSSENKTRVDNSMNEFKKVVKEAVALNESNPELPKRAALDTMDLFKTELYAPFTAELINQNMQGFASLIVEYNKNASIHMDEMSLFSITMIDLSELFCKKNIEIDANDKEELNKIYCKTVAGYLQLSQDQSIPTKMKVELAEACTKSLNSYWSYLSDEDQTTFMSTCKSLSNSSNAQIKKTMESFVSKHS